MDFELRVVRGRSATEALKLVDGVTSIGRQDDCNIRIKSSSVSRKHCEVFEKKGILLVKDLGSSNGTLVNGKKISGQQVVEPGDELTIGGIKLIVAKIGEAPPPPKTPPAATPASPAAAAPLGGDDDFDIDFNELPEAVAIDEEDDAVVPDVDGFEIQLDTEMDAPTSAPSTPTPASKTAPSTNKAKPSQPAPKAPEPKPVAPPPDEADEAIADFLLDLKLDDD